jgi:hypothetical protein
MGRNPLKKFLYNYTSHLMVSSSLTFEVRGSRLYGKVGIRDRMGSRWNTSFNTHKGEKWNRIAEFLFETMLLKRVHRTGYQFLGPGKESVAEHTFGVMCIAWTLAELSPEARKGRLLAMCLLHDLPEARMGDLNAVQKHTWRPTRSWRSST